MIKNTKDENNTNSMKPNIKKVDKKDKQKSETNKSKLWGYRVAIIIAFVIIIILLLFRSCVSKDLLIDVTPPQETMALDDNLSDKDNYKTVDPNSLVESITISMNTVLVFNDGSSSTNFDIVNKDTNKHQIMVEIIRDDNGETIYKSGLIPVGKRINSAKLSKALPKGEYKCTAYFNYISEEDNATNLGKGGAKITVKVNN